MFGYQNNYDGIVVTTVDHTKNGYSCHEIQHAKYTR